jgi:hypothetical protein
MKQVLTRLTVAIVLLTASSLAAAAVLPLQGRDINGNPVAANAASAVFEYDPNLDITWLRDWNVNGQQNWVAQKAWAESLPYFGGGWRLPTTTQPDASCGVQIPDATFGPQGWGYGCIGSEMGYMYYTELGNSAGGPLTNTGPFQNMQSSDYWSGTEYAPSPSSAWKFYPLDGFQVYVGKGDALYAVAVRPGDVVPPPPPIPTLSQWSLVLFQLNRPNAT